MAIQKVLIANRGEIAVRVIKTCKEQGIRTVGIYSDADKRAVHVQLADESYCVGPAPSQESYLRQDVIIDIALRSKSEAIHPGYGFLSENAEFAKKVIDAGILWLGPPPSAILAMGSKIQAKQLLKGNKDVPLIPGSTSAVESKEQLISLADEIGFPVLLKASAGGGGKGMRVVRSSNELSNSLEQAQREALSSFGDSSMLLERYFEDVKHIEVQIIGDIHGNVSHLFERECSVQRRHQKIIEEAPSSCLTPDVRKKLLKSAIEIGKAIGYQSVGTVEFIYEAKTQKFYFLEVNTRLQVEHPVTEMITDLDLVLLQLLIAEGNSLSKLGIDNLQEFNGHSIECRLCAEDPNNNFFPCTGPIQLWLPSDNPNIRYDTGIQSGSEISVYYDPMIAKVISWGENRNQAIQRMKDALRETVVMGLPTNREFLLEVLSNSSFIDCSFNTHLLDNQYSESVRAELTSKKLNDNYKEISIIGMLHEWYLVQSSRTLLRNISSGWRNNRYSLQTKLFQLPNNEIVEVKYKFIPQRKSTSYLFEIHIEDNQYQVELMEHNEHSMRVAIDGCCRSYTVCNDNRNPDRIEIQSKIWGSVSLIKKNRLLLNDEDEEELEGDIISPMPARILEIHVNDGEKVEQGKSLLTVESMKMQSTYQAPLSGIVRLFVKKDQLVEAGTLIISVEQEQKEE